jgi:hypothetical protein
MTNFEVNIIWSTRVEPDQATSFPFHGMSRNKQGGKVNGITGSATLYVNYNRLSYSVRVRFLDPPNIPLL